jgi:hypothetical protein
MTDMKFPTDEELAAVIEKITADVHAKLPQWKVAVSDLLRVLSDNEWAKVRRGEDRRRYRNANEAAIAGLDTSVIYLDDVVAQLPALTKIKRDLDYRLPGSGRPLANIVLAREQAIELLAFCAGKGER